MFFTIRVLFCVWVEVFFETNKKKSIGTKQKRHKKINYHFFFWLFVKEPFTRGRQRGRKREKDRQRERERERMDLELTKKKFSFSTARKSILFDWILCGAGGQVGGVERGEGGNFFFFFGNVLKTVFWVSGFFFLFAKQRLGNRGERAENQIFVCACAPILFFFTFIYFLFYLDCLENETHWSKRTFEHFTLI